MRCHRMKKAEKAEQERSSRRATRMIVQPLPKKES